jgi:serine/threonine protein kinase
MAEAASKTQGNPPPKTGASKANEQPLPDLTGRTLGDYQILRRLGVGGMGQVYLARQLSLKREVALKLLRDELNKNPMALMRFQAEAEAVAKLNHPNIVHIHQMGEAEGLRYMALEYVEGRNLRDHLARKGPPDLPVTLSIIRQVVLAIQQAHEHGIVHRDIKPENILVTRKVEVKVTDFGLSRYFAGETPALNLTQSGITLGTPLYMSPEQVQGHPVDHRSDIYSLGVTCYHLLAGEPPFRGATAFDVALKHVQDQPPRLAELCPDLPPDLCGMVHKMMAKNPDDRYSSAREILRELAKVRDSLALNAGGPNSIAHLQPQVIAISEPMPIPAALTYHNALQTTDASNRRRLPRKWGRWALAIGACLVATTGGVLLSSTKSRPPEPTPTPSPASNSSGNSTAPTDLRPEGKIVPARERELLALIRTETTKPDDYLKASIELGLLYVQERRLDEANSRFIELEKKHYLVNKADNDPIPGAAAFNLAASMAGRLGRAVALAYRPPKTNLKSADDAKAEARASNDLVMNVVNDPFPNAKGKQKDKLEKLTFQAVSAFLVKHPDLYQALSEALNRNMSTLGLTRLDPPALDLLRSPPRLGLK